MNVRVLVLAAAVGLWLYLALVVAPRVDAAVIGGGVHSSGVR